MAFAMFEIRDYMVIWRQLETRDFNGTIAKIRGIVRCSGIDAENNEYMMEIFMLAPDSAFPDPIIELDNRRGAIFFPITDMYALVDMLRNEKPIFGHLRTDRPEWTGITTTKEPVGEGEG
ncbi:hypothetical protein MASR2M15_06050 [Anaerolineales bacterium]